jgi:anthranilate synthase component 1
LEYSETSQIIAAELAASDVPIVYPIARRLSADLLTPVAALLRLRQGSEGSFLFESVEGGEKLARYSFIGRNPFRVIRLLGGSVFVEDPRSGVVERASEGIYATLRSYMLRYREVRQDDLPRFTGGAVGYMGYDTIRQLERLPDCPVDDLSLPDAHWGFYHSVVAFDHVKHQIILIENIFADHDTEIGAAVDAARDRMDRTTEDLCTPAPSPSSINLNGQQLRSNFSRSDFMQAVEQAKELIRDGDIFQVVLSQRFEQRFEGDDFNLYRALRQVNPSPYLFYLDLGGYSLIGSSPELLVRVEGRRVETLPIAGTRPRGADANEDGRLADELLADPKENAEHVMLVDLGRNDLSRVCRDGTVRVERFKEIERYSHVMHIVSSVAGHLDENVQPVDALAACFPAGTVSGAPKIRAMEIIDRLEPNKRGVYAGSVGYVDFSGALDTCIAIRTMVVKGDTIYIQAGAGIVADSVPEAEFDETINKARALTNAIQLAARELF